ncbi:MAG: HupE/UreJ family protein [Chitinophagaceae bacterium]
MNNFSIYFQLGFNHIANWGALDHILFMAALCMRYQFADWKRILILVTAFTIGHTITLGLCVLDVISFSSKWIEFLIPLTIVCTACSNLFVKKFSFNSKFPLIYWFTLFFGFVHGLGFSNDLKSIIGNDTGLITKLFAANLGIETAQILFVIVVLIIGIICTNFIKINKREYVLFVSGAIFGTALYIAANRLPF